MDNEEKKKYEFNQRKAEGVAAGVHQSPMQNLKSAWMNLKTGLGLEKKKPANEEQEDR